LRTDAIGDDVGVRLPPLLMVGVSASTLTLLLFGVALVAQTAPPVWLWTLNAVGIAYGLWSFGYWCRRANR
jgi:hypothetical protein